MNNDTIAILGWAATLISPVITIYVQKYLTEKNRYKSIEPDKRNAVDGLWEGNFTQTLHGKEISPELVMDINVAHTGAITGTAKFTHNEKLVRVKIKGGFHNENFLKMNYWNPKKHITQFGAFIFEIDYFKSQIKGYFVGYGPEGQMVIAGPAELKKAG